MKTGMETAPAALREATERLLADATPYAEVQSAVAALHAVFAAGAGDAFPGGSERVLDSGVAIGPDAAAACLFDHVRTRQFLRGVAAGLRLLRERFPGETLRVVYAGTGPYAPLVLPLATVFGPDEVRFTLLDVNPVAAATAARLADALGARRHIDAVRVCDATTYRHGVPFHLFVSETMQRALVAEPQVSIAANLGAQLVEGGVMVPGAIVVRAAVVEDPATHRSGRQGFGEALEQVDLGEVFRLDLPAARRLAGHGTAIAAATLAVPDLPFAHYVLVLHTSVETFPGLTIDAGSSGLTHPYFVFDAPPFAPGDRLAFTYRIGPSPRWDVARADGP